MKRIEPMDKPLIKFPASRAHKPRVNSSSCTDQVIGDILSGWRYDISGISPAMRVDYEQHLSECGHCHRRQQIARTIDVLLISVSTLSILIRRVELVTHLGTIHGTLKLPLHQTHIVAISLEAVAVAGMFFSSLLWVLVAIATPLPGFLGGILQQRLPADLRTRFTKDAA
jgi:hypothetical protein